MIIIIKFNNSDNIIKELFHYNGYCNITNALIVDKNTNKYPLYIDKSSITIWNSMGKKRKRDGTTIAHEWGSLTATYDDMIFNGRNDFTEGIKFVTKKDPDTNVITQTKESVLKLSKIAKKDINLTTLASVRGKVGKVKKTAKTSKIRTTGGY